MRAALLLAAACAALGAQDATNEFRYSLSLGDEAGYAAGMRVPGPRTGNLGLLQSSFAWRRGDRWRFSTSAAALAVTGDETHARVRVKETYFGFTLGDFDFLAGKKVLKWGTGYAFTPTGVLDPPRDPADPTDRFNLNEGRELASVEFIRGRHAVTAAWASGGLLQKHRAGLRETFALRHNTLVGGFDTSLVVARERGRPVFTGANFTRVLGESVEIHAEVAHRESTAVLVGSKYSLRSGVRAIAEFYSAGRYGFFHLGKSRLRERPGWKEWDVSGAVLVNLRDRSRMLILDVNRRVGNRLSVYSRAQAPGGAKWRSEYGMIPYAALVSCGFRVQL
jgi:hypothetical protein